MMKPTARWRGSARQKWWAGTGLNRRHQDFQTRLHPLARTNDLLASAMIRSFRGIDLLCASESEHIATHDSVRVEFESSLRSHSGPAPSSFPPDYGSRRVLSPARLGGDDHGVTLDVGDPDVRLHARDLALALDAFLAEPRRCWRLHGEGLNQEGAWLTCSCAASLYLKELPSHPTR